MSRPKRDYEFQLASRLMEIAADEFNNHGCNDVDPKLFAGIPVKSRVVLLEDFNEWYQSTFHVPIPWVNFDEIGDHQWMQYMAWKLSGENLSPQI